MLTKNYKPMLSKTVGMGFVAKDFPVTTWGGKKSNEYFESGSYTLYSDDLSSLYAKPVDVSSYIYDGSYNVGYGVVFGTGTIAPTSDDYCMSGTAIDNLTSTNVTHTVSYENTDVYRKMIIEYTISNSTEADITIGEIGLVSAVNGRKAGSSNTSYYPILVERTVLDSPVTIPKDGVGRVTYTITMNYPT